MAERLTEDRLAQIRSNAAMNPGADALPRVLSQSLNDLLADYDRLRAELADATDPYAWQVITIEGRSIYESGRLSEREARKRYSEASRENGRRPGLYRARRWWTDGGYGPGGWEQVRNADEER